MARTLRFDPGTIVVMDRGYVDYAWFGQLMAQDVFFVTRRKDATQYKVVERRPAPARGGILRDEFIELTLSRRRRNRESGLPVLVNLDSSEGV